MYLITLGSFIIFSSSFEALLKVLALTDITKEGTDLRATYLLKYLRNAAAVMFETNSYSSCYATCKQTYPRLSVLLTCRFHIKRTKINQSDLSKCRIFLRSATRQGRRWWCLIRFPLKLLTNCTAKQEPSDKVTAPNDPKGWSQFTKCLLNASMHNSPMAAPNNKCSEMMAAINQDGLRCRIHLIWVFKPAMASHDTSFIFKQVPLLSVSMTWCSYCPSVIAAPPLSNTIQLPPCLHFLPPCQLVSSSMFRLQKLDKLEDPGGNS